MKIPSRITDIFHRSRRIKKIYHNLNIIYIFSLVSLFFNFYSDIDTYNTGLSINSFQGELSIIGINLLVIQSVLIIYNIDKNIIDKKIKILKGIQLDLSNLIGICFSIYLVLLYFFITQSNAFGVNPLFKNYGIGFYTFLTLQIIALFKLLKIKNV
ncbi:hypothetical protein HOJ01_00930 [bacterium]|jgi:hypothetical protein|nr:hypothetical protein [bacterium]MBT6293352.1 hypothetical protein [bacterium]